jgi:PKD repeat protein
VVNSTSANGGYTRISGTSMATPHVAGATALALSAAGGSAPDRVAEAFSLTAFGSGSKEPGTRYGHGAADALAVTDHLADDAFVSGTVVDGSGSPIQGAKVSVEGLRVDSTGGGYEVGLAKGTWSLEASADGYDDNTKTVSLKEDETVQTDIVLQETNPGSLDVTIDSTNTPVTEGDRLTVDATVKNTGTKSDTQTVSLSVGGKQRDASTVSVGGGGTTTKTLEWKTAAGDAGDYTATVETEDDTDTAPVTVNPGANFEVTVDSTNSPVTEGDRLTVDATVQNTGGATETKTVELSVGGAVRDSTSLNIADGASRSVRLGWTTGGGDAGDYTATVETEDDTATKPVSVDSSGGGNAQPTASFGYSPNSPDTSDSITFDASGSSDTDGTVQKYEWDLGDGTTATGVSPTHSYGSSGDYTVTLTVTDDDGATGTRTKTVSVTDNSDGGNTGGSINDVQVTLSDEDGDGLDDRVEVEVTEENALGTTVTLGESNFEVDLSTDTTQGIDVSFDDTDGDGDNESVTITTFGPSSATRTVTADLSGQSDGETGTVNVSIDQGADSESATYTVGGDGGDGGTGSSGEQDPTDDDTDQPDGGGNSDSSAGTDGDDADDESGSGEGMPGFTPVVALFAVALSAAYHERG